MSKRERDRNFVDNARKRARRDRDRYGRGNPSPPAKPAKRNGFRVEPVLDHPCPCGAICTPTDGARVMPTRPDLAHRRFYLCEKCGRRCGAHPGSWEPIGVPATIVERRLRMVVHGKFDEMWMRIDKRERNQMRCRLYSWLSHQLGLPLEQTHVGMMDERTLRRAIIVIDAERERLGLPGPSEDS